MTRPEPFTVLLDVDGVLCDWHGEARRVLAAMGAEPPHEAAYDLTERLAPPHLAAFWQRTAVEGWAYGLRPYDGARAFVDALRAAGDEVLFLTAPMRGPTWGYERTEWLIKHMGARRSDVILGSAKQHVDGDAFVEDRTDTLVAWLRRRIERGFACPLGLLFPRPYNADGAYAHSLLKRLGASDPYGGALDTLGAYRSWLVGRGAGAP
jgi:hypothetical protein